MTDLVGGTEWLRKQRELICPEAKDRVARRRMQMTHRFRPVLEPLPAMLGEPVPPPLPPAPPPEE